MKHRVVISVTNDLVNDQRVHRVCTTLHESGMDVMLVGRLKKSSKPIPRRPYKICRMRLFFEKGKWFYFEYNFRLLLKLLFIRADVFHANDLDTLPANYYASRIRRKKLVYDAHEYFTEVPELQHRPKIKRIWEKFEKRMVPKVDLAFTVNRSIAEIYTGLYQVPFQVLRNLPFRKKREKNAKDLSERILIYQGALNLGRGIALMMDAMAFLEGYQLWIAGTGDLEDELREYRENLPFRDRIRFLGLVQLDELHQYTSQACLGLSLEEDLGMNYRLALPNKLFDYLQAGIPALVSDLPEMAGVIKEYEAGGLLPDARRNPAELATQISSICEDESKYAAMRQRVELAAQELCWEKESDKLLAAYEKLWEARG